MKSIAMTQVIGTLLAGALSTVSWAAQIVTPVMAGNSVGPGTRFVGDTVTMKPGERFLFVGQYSVSGSQTASESGLGLKVAYDSNFLEDVVTTPVLTKCMIALPSDQLKTGATREVIMGWIDTSVRRTSGAANGAVGWPGTADPASPGATDGCLNPGGIVTTSAAAVIPGALFIFTAKLKSTFTSGTTTVQITSDSFSYANPNPGFQGIPLTVVASAAGALTSGDLDGDGIPNAVETAEGRNPYFKDNQLFVGQNASSNRWFVMQQYRDFLAREGEPAGITSSTNALNTGTTREVLVTGFFNSPEFQDRYAPLVRLYLSYFNRFPDYDGLRNNVAARQNGAALPTMAQQFSESPEFLNTYGTISNGAFVNLCYQNVLGRAPDQSGYDYWLGQLNSNAMTRGQVMLGFSESSEFKQLSYNEVVVSMTYIGLLSRSPDSGGFTGWLNYLDAGGNLQTMFTGFLASPEYFYRFLPR